MKIGDFRKILDSVLAEHSALNFKREKDSFFIRDGNFLVGAIRVQGKYSSLCQEVDYWLCAGHTFITIDGKRDKEISDNHLLYPFRIPWKSAKRIKPKKLQYDPMSWDDRHYDILRIEYGNASESEINKKINDIVNLVISAAEGLGGLTIEDAFTKIANNNGDVWLGMQYIDCYKQQFNG